MLKKTGIVVGLLGVLALSSFLMSCGSGSDRPTGVLYAVSQSLENVSSYSLDLASGELSLITNDMAPTCADTSCGSPTAISLDPTGATAFVLGQNAISAFTVNSDGSLSQPTTAATLQSGQIAQAEATTAAGDMMFVISTVANPTNCTTDGGYNPAASNCPAISVFSTKAGSTTVTPTGNNCAVLNGPCPYSLSRVPTGVSVLTLTLSGGATQTVLFVSSNHDLTSFHNDSEVSMFFVDSSGNLTEQSASPYSAQAPNPLSVFGVNTNPAGQPTLGGVFVYVGSQAAVAGSVSGFEVCTQVDANCSSGDVQNENLRVAVMPTTVGEKPVAMIADPTNTFLYIACYYGNNIYGFKMTPSTGALTPLNPGLRPTGTGPVSMAIHPSNNNSNEFLYVANNTASTLVGYSVNLTSGDLGNPMAPVIFTSGNPYGLAGR